VRLSRLVALALIAAPLATPALANGSMGGGSSSSSTSMSSPRSGGMALAPFTFNGISAAPRQYGPMPMRGLLGMGADTDVSLGGPYKAPVTHNGIFAGPRVPVTSSVLPGDLSTPSDIVPLGRGRYGRVSDPGISLGMFEWMAEGGQ